MSWPIPSAFESIFWESYKLGEFANIKDPKTGNSFVRIMFWNPGPGDFTITGIGKVQIGINELQKNGVMFGVCSVVIMIIINGIVQKMNADLK